VKARYLCLAALVLAAFVATPAAAQQTADIIRGRVIGPDSQPIPNANILVTSFMGGINKTTKTDKNGKFGVVFPNGEGDYMVGIASIGYNFKRFEVKRIADEEILLADTKLEKTVARLDTVNITAAAKRGTPPRPISGATTDLSGTDKFVGSPPGSANGGNVAAMLGGLPGFQLIPGVDGNPDMLSVFGLPPDQNNTTLNGANGSTSDIPRDAAVGVGASTSPWDVSRGGFSGVQVQITTRSGTNYLAQGLSSQLDAPPLQWTDEIGNSTGAKSTRMSLGTNFSGPLTQDRSFYSTSLQYDRTFKDIQTLFNTNAQGLQTAGVSPDSATRLRGVLQQLGIPATVSGFGNYASDNLRQQAAFDFSPKAATSGSSYQIAENFNWTRTAPISASLMSTPASSGESQSLNGVAVARHTNYLWASVLTQTWLSASVNSTKNEPNLAFPSANVRVSSDLDDGTSAVRNLQFGGNSSIGRNATTGLLGAKNQLSWLAGNNKHALKLTTEFRGDWYSLDDPANRRGTFSFQSLGDLEAGTPSQFTRQLANIHDDAKQLVGSVALGDAWRPKPTVQVVYGLRLDGNRFMTRADYNPAVMDAVGVRNDGVPNKMYVSPRIGMSWQYGTANVIPIQDFYTFGPRAVIKAGVGIYQNTAGANLLGNTLSQTGLPGASQTLVCQGPAAPLPDWDQYLTNPNAVPSECANGQSVFASNLPSVSLFDKNYVQPRTLRANVNWFGGVLDNRFTLTADATYSLGLNQTGTVDLNFNPQSQFALDNEGGRPVFARATSIDPASGFVATRDARLSPDFTQIRSIRSDLRNSARQVSFSLNPFFINPTRFRWSASYTLQDVHDRYNGFSSTAGSPLGFADGRSSTSMHQIGFNLSYNFWDYVTVGWQGGFQSGQRFTPGVSGDVNGDGSLNDRAFVFDPASASDPAVAAAMQTLLSSGPSVARDCLTKQTGRVADRNSCTGPWKLTGGILSVSLNSQKVWMPPRTRFTINIQNPLTAADLLVNGSKNLHGWGATPSPDANLLYVRGFDPATQRYKYEVNPRFGSTSTSQNIQRSPVVITAGFSVDVGPTRDWQGMRMALERGRAKPGTKVTDAQMRTMSSALGVYNPMSRILSQREQMRLTRKQSDSLSSMSRAFQFKLDSLWLPLAEYYTGLPTDFNHGLAHEKFVDARQAIVDHLMVVAPAVKSLLTPQQNRKLASTMGLFLEPRYLKMLREGLVSSGLSMEMMMMSMR
jgi:hypothetical protein